MNKSEGNIPKSTSTSYFERKKYRVFYRSLGWKKYGWELRWINNLSPFMISKYHDLNSAAKVQLCSTKMLKVSEWRLEMIEH